MTYNDSTCALLKQSIEAGREALLMVQSRVVREGDARRAFEIMLVKKSIEECEAILCLLGSDLRVPATSHIRTLTNGCATVLKLHSGIPSDNFARFLSSAVFESMRVFEASKQSGFPLTFITNASGWNGLREELKREHDHDFKNKDSWADGADWQNSILLQDEWLSLVFQFVQWYNKFQHVTPLGLATEQAAKINLLVPSQHTEHHKRALDRSIRISDFLTKPEVIAWLAVGLLRRIIETALDYEHCVATIKMEETELELSKAVGRIRPKTIRDLKSFDILS